MESKKFDNFKIYEQFKFEYRDSAIYSWKDFVIEKDIGVDCIGEEGGYAWEFEYTVTDEQKWFLAKIKYGI